MRFLLCGVLFAAVTGGQTLTNVRVIDGTGRVPLEHATVEIRNGKIASITPIRTSTPASRTVMPGIINAHGHVGLVKGTALSSKNYTGLNILHQLTQYEEYGVTTVMSLGLNKDYVYQFRAEQGKGNEPGATLLTAGRGIGVPKGAPAVDVDKDQVYRPKSADEARQAVREMAAHAPNLIKIWVDGGGGKYPKMAPEIWGAVIDESHRAGLKVAAHVFACEDARGLVDHGVDILAHSVRDRELDAETVSAIKNKGVAYIPTLQLEESFYIFGEQPAFMAEPFFHRAVDESLLKKLADEKKVDAATHRKAFDIAMQNVRKLHAQGVPVYLGTDSGANPYRLPGWAEHRELQLLVQAGLTPLEAIRAASGANAELLGIADRTGTLARGKAADLIVLTADPSKDIRNTEKIDYIMHSGKRVGVAKTSSLPGTKALP